MKVSASLAAPNDGAANTNARFTPGAGTAWAITVAQVTAAVAELGKLGGEMVVDCVYWTSSATAISTRADDTHLIEYPADMRTLMRRISALLGVWDRLLPISLMACKESTLDADPAFDSLEHNSRIVEFLELYPNAAVTDTRDFKRVDDVSFTGDLTMGLGRAMAQVVNGTSVAVALEG